MKMVKSLLLSSAAGVVAVTAGQAADLPVKAKPVEYVKICSLYGAGFYYMPGTDMCIKIGGWVRAEAGNHANGSLAWGPFNVNQNNRLTNNLVFRARGYITADAREQTAYGTARAYIAVGLSSNFTGNAPNDSPVFSANRAVVQWAGITAGLSQSFYDFYSSAALNYRAGNLTTSDTGDAGWFVWGYTAQLGNGFSATISAENARINQIIGVANSSEADNDVLFPATTSGPGYFPESPATFIGGGSFGAVTAGAGYGGLQAPDIVGNLRVDQTWGSAQVMGALHELVPDYYAQNDHELVPGGAGAFTTGTGGCVGAGSPAIPGPTTGYVSCGHPGDDWGFVVGAGLKLNFPMIAQGDYFSSQFNYTRGALRYLYHGGNSNVDHVDGASQAFGISADCVYGGSINPGGAGGASTATDCQLTTGWSVAAGYEHYWTPQLHQSLAGSYMKVEYNDTANNILCVAAGDGNGKGGTEALANPGCNNDWSIWSVGSRLQYDVTKSFYLGVEALYSRMNGGSTSDGLLHGYALNAPANPITVESHADNWVFTARMHKDFLP